MCLVITILGIAACVGAWFLAPILNTAGIIAVLILLVLLYLWARKYGNTITPGMEETAPSFAMFTIAIFLLSAGVHHWSDEIVHFFRLFIR